MKKLISLRIDTELLNWFKQKKPDGYQKLIHSVLANYRDIQINEKHRIAGRAQELYKQYYTQCFWHLTPDLEITPDNINLVIEGLKKYGGRKGFLIANELCH